MIKRIAILLPLVVCMACAGSSPPVRYYLLTPAAPEGVAPVRAGAEKALLVLEPVDIPPYLNRTQIVTRNSENHLQLAQYDQWGDTLRENISRVLLENLSIVLGTDRLATPTALPQERLTLRLAAQVTQFERGADGQVVLKVRWRLVEGRTGKLVLVRQSQFAAGPVQATDYEGLAARMSGLLWEWSREMAREMEEHLR
ncbi:MAG: PqiC family protein [Magnetococcus sp. DMHC-8]